MHVLIEYGKILIPASLVLYAVYLSIRTLIAKEIEMKRLDAQARNIEIVLPLRLAAYERMVLFLERMSPENMLMRLTAQHSTAKNLRNAIFAEIQHEYHHNIAQQIYVGVSVWEQIKRSKNDLKAHIDEVFMTMDEVASASDLSNRLLQFYIDKQEGPMDEAILALKKEIQSYF